MRSRYDPRTALVVVDVQNDFADPAGSLHVPGGEEVVAAANREVRRAVSAGAAVYYTQDWHPPTTPHFEKDGGVWPVHCVRDTWGAQLHPGLVVDGEIIHKGSGGEDGYSAFTVRDPETGATSPTGLEERLRARSIERVVVIGLATDYCVKETAIDAAHAGFRTEMLRDVARPVDLEPGDGERAVAAMRRAGVEVAPAPGTWIDAESAPLLVDLYELTMAAAYHRIGLNHRASFELSVRGLPEQRNFLVAAGVEEAVSFLENLHFGEAAVAYLASLDIFTSDFLEELAHLKFSGDVWAVPEGEVVFATEPLLRIDAPLIEAQLAETFLLNAVGFQTMIASKAARVAIASGDRPFVEFGARRTHGADAALKAARAAFIGGAAATSLVAAGREYGIPVRGTMAHSFVQAHASEAEAFRAFARTFPEDAVLLIDTYDTEQGARVAAEVAAELAGEGFRLRGVRLDSGDLGRLARSVRAVLDEAGLDATEIFASGNLDELRIAGLLAAGSPIDAFGVGTRLSTSSDAPSLNVVYKLVEDAAGPKLKLSTGKSTLPGRKQVFRHGDHDELALAGEDRPGRPILTQSMSAGVRLRDPRPLARIQRDTAAAVAALPARLRSLEPQEPYRVELSPALAELNDRLTEELGAP